MSSIKISIIVATRHREKILWESVEKAIIAIKNKNAEIIVVNDGDISLTIPASMSARVSYLQNEKKGVSSARNLGAQKANGEILFFVDDDMWISSDAIDWIQRNYIDMKRLCESVCFFDWEYPPSLQQRLNKTKIGNYLLESDYHTFWGRLHTKDVKPQSGLYSYDSIASCSLVMHKELFWSTGGYNEKMEFQGEDADLAKRFISLEIPIYIVFDICLKHNHSDRLDIDNFLKRSYDGFGSEFKAVKCGIAIPIGKINYKGLQKLLFEFSRLTEKVWISIFNMLPNHSLITPFTNRLIGALGGLQRYKQWKKITQ